MSDVYDVVIVGGGSGGYAAAIRAAELGKTVAIIEQDKLGGTCLHRGCIPTKALLHSAEAVDSARSAERMGLRFDLGTIDGAGLKAFREGIVAKKFKGLAALVAAHKITLITGAGSLTSDGAVDVDGRVVRGTDIVLATGSVPRLLPGITVSDRVLTSEQALELSRIPARVVILGGGVIGVEFASAWRSLGSSVTIVEALDRLVPAEDEDVSRGLTRALTKRGIEVKTATRVTSVTEKAKTVTIALDDDTTLSADTVLVAVGRAPATASLGLAEAGVAVTDGFVDVGEDLATTREHVWAIGDVVAGLQLAHRSYAHGIFVAERIAGLTPKLSPDLQIPKVTYSHPEAASVGLTEAQAVEQFGRDEVRATTFNLAGNAKSEILGTTGFVKVLRRREGPVIGVHLLGDRVSEMITEAQLAVAWDAYPEDLAPLLHAHPTQSEALGEAFLTLAGKPLHSL